MSFLDLLITKTAMVSKDLYITNPHLVEYIHDSTLLSEEYKVGLI